VQRKMAGERTVAGIFTEI